MTFGESFAWFCVALLAVYGCAQVVRNVCLWLTRCPRCVTCCRLAIPHQKADLIPLVRCLQSQTVWEEPAVCCHTFVVLPADIDVTDVTLRRIFEEAPMVIPITSEDLTTMVTQWTKEK